mmetsp:Transcript_65276/g.77274  ORF Transcript_65276/g.77274 Transcript_65276/m.77274 type:complete len:210 (+) Transcript_65276:307-936(+)
MKLAQHLHFSVWHFSFFRSTEAHILRHKRLKDLISVVAKEKILRVNSHERKHSKSAVVKFLILVVNPSLVAVVNPVRRSKKITWLVSGSCLNLLGKPFNSPATEDELKPSNSRKLFHGLKRVTRKSTVEGGVYTSGGDVPSKACGHGNTSVFEFGFTVHGHSFVSFSPRETERIEETNRGGNSNNGLVYPCRKGSLRRATAGRGECRGR